MQPIAALNKGQAIQQVQPWLLTLARLGYAGKGVLYTLIGLLALQPLLGNGGKATNQKGAIDEIARQPMGEVLLIAVGIGLIGYSIWRLLVAFSNPEHQNVLKRVAYVVSAIAYGTLGFLCFRSMTGQRAGAENSEKTQVGLTAELLSQPYGKYLVLLLAAIIAGVALVQFANGATGKFEKTLKVEEMSESEKGLALTLGRVGFIARGFVFAVIAWFIAKAAITFDPHKSKGFAGALKEIAQAPFGHWLFGAVAVGLIAYGAFMFVMAKYRRMTPIQ
jgi:hypothetical protein